MFYCDQETTCIIGSAVFSPHTVGRGLVSYILLEPVLLWKRQIYLGPLGEWLLGLERTEVWALGEFRTWTCSFHTPGGRSYTGAVCGPSRDLRRQAPHLPPSPTVYTGMGRFGYRQNKSVRSKQKWQVPLLLHPRPVSGESTVYAQWDAQKSLLLQMRQIKLSFFINGLWRKMVRHS